MAAIYVTRKIPQPGMDMLLDREPETGINPDNRALTPDELKKAVVGNDAVLCLLTDTIDVQVLENADRAVVFANFAVGFNNVDVSAATERGILVTNTPGVLTDATADMAWALLFAVARQVVAADRYTREGRFEGWDPLLFLGGDISERTLGIVGAGRIGTAVGERAAGFRMRVIYASNSDNDAMDRLGAKRVKLDELLAEADFVSVHVPLNEETTHIIGARELGIMKPTAYLINTARGPVVDEAVLVEALAKKKIAGAGLDVFEEEPAMAPGLAELDNVVIAPHIASATVMTRNKMATMAAGNLLAALDGTRPDNLVNPEVLGSHGLRADISA
ncbi:MAG: D-glycerate dehydrogenase [Candidatus Latescibacteria bacterium]|jgi:lactate dehydrogenase-like 2-hydroxyacid dehydrogenase|nr:D-glycerate dehydrogenase [Candidatus Latescibacterota bacterium]